MTTRTPQDYAKPCPFCGHAELVFAEGSTFRWIVASCNGCGVTMPETRLEMLTRQTKEERLADAKTEAIAAWNRRAPQSGWISVDERLPRWAARDDMPCFINGKAVPPTLFSETVLVALQGGGVRTDKMTTIEGKSDGWWHTYGERVIAWQPAPLPPSTKGEPT